MQASPRVRAGYAAPLFSAVAFMLAAGVSLEGSPFCVRAARDAVVVDGPRVDPRLAGVYDTTWGTIALEADGTARGQHHRASDAGAAATFDVVGRWHITHDAGSLGHGARGSVIHFEWATGSFAAAREWWKPAAAPPH